jgi:hypothetical protein
MKPVLFLLLACLALDAQDRRNTVTPNTDTHLAFNAPAEKAAWEARRPVLQQQILSAAGLDPLPARTPLNPIVTGRIEGPGYTIEKVALETLPGFWLGANLYRPAGKTGKFPAVLYPHGHWTYGRLEHQPLYSGPTLGVNLARHGFVVLAYDMIGYNDTIQLPHDFGSSKPEMLWSFGPLGLQLWNSLRVVDFLQTLPDVDPARIAVTGASGGGTQTFLLAAIDPRIVAAAPVNMVSLIMQGGCVCENTPGLRVDTNNVEIAALTCPRPQFLVAATGDWTRNVPKEEFPALQSVYRLYAAESALGHAQFNSPHNYHKDSREAVYDFLRRTFYPSEAAWKERDARIEKLGDMLAFHGRALPAGALDAKGVLEQWKEMSRRQSAAATPAQRRERLLRVFHAAWPAKVEAINGALSRPGLGDRIPFRFTEGQGEARLLLSLGATAQGPTLAIDPFQTGSAAAPRDRSHRQFLTFNVSDDAARVQDLLTALRYLELRGHRSATIEASGEARYWALAASVLAPLKVTLAFDAATLPFDDATLERSFFVSGLLRAGGLKNR